MITRNVEKASYANTNKLFFRVSHPWMTTAIFFPIVLFLLYISYHYEPRPLPWVILYLVTGLFLWTFVEYILHRFVFHLTKIKEPWRSIASGLHMAHHREPDAKDLILAPPMMTVSYSAIIFLTLWAITGKVGILGLVMSGLLLGYTAYEWFHYGSHAYQPKLKVAKYLKQYHLKHHFKDPNGTFGVTNPIWDYVFRTNFERLGKSSASRT